MVTVLRTTGSERRSTVDSDSDADETSGTPGSGSIGGPLTPPETTPRSTRASDDRAVWFADDDHIVGYR